jgi:small subunit ribosomal protein S2
MVDTNSDPREVEFVIPSNDDASKSIDKILSLVTAAVEGLSDRGSDKEADATETAAQQLRKQLQLLKSSSRS